MNHNQLPEPVLTLAFGAVANIQQGDEQSLGRLWAVLTKVRDAVADGHRLENLSWRLWHRARIASTRMATAPSGGLPRYPEIFSRTFTSPPLSFSSSSEGTTVSSDWDRDTAVGEDDGFQVMQNAGVRRNTALSPLTEKARLNWVLTHASPSLAPSSTCVCLHHQGYFPWALPPNPPHLSLTNKDAEVHSSRVRPSDIPLPEPLHQSLNPALPIAGRLEVPSSASSPVDSTTPRTVNAQHPITLPSSESLPHTQPSASDASVLVEVLNATAASSSMPITLTTSDKSALTVGHLIAQLFSQPSMRKFSQDNFLRYPPMSVQFKEAQDMSAPQIPKIIEPRPSLGSMTSCSIQPSISPTAASNSNSVSTSATSTPRQAFPTVVVVNPTPHPTPPATPSPGVSGAQFDFQPGAISIDRPNICPERGWSGSVSGQLGTPVSMNCDAKAVEPIVQDVQPVMDHHQELHTAMPHTEPPLTTAAIALPDRPANFISSSHLLTPVSRSPSTAPTSEMSSYNPKTARAATSSLIPTPSLPEEKKFFLATPTHGSGGSGQDSSESPDSLGVGSVSPERNHALHGGPPLGARNVGSEGQDPAIGRQGMCHRREDTPSSFSTSSLPRRVQSETSLRGGFPLSSRLGGRSGSGMASGPKRKPPSKKVVLAVNESLKDMEDAAQVKQMEVKQGKSVEREERTLKGKGKEKRVSERGEDTASASVGSATHIPMVESQQPQQPQQHLPSRRSHHHPQTQGHHLRQLPTNPPRRYQSPVRRPAPPAETQSRANPPALPNTRQLPYDHPQLGHLGLGHLPTVPPKQRRPIEITETSSDYETTDTEGDESSWESESISGDEAGDGKSANHHSKPGRSVEGPTTNRGKPSGAKTSTSNSRTRDAGEFARDAALEAQRQRDLFQKLPPRSYSNLARLQRAKSGLSLLFRPDPELFPEGHPYRTTQNSRDILARNWSAPAPPWALTTTSKRATPAGPVQAVVNAAPVIASVNSKTSTTATAGKGNSQHSSGYRPRVKPDDQEEETTSDEQDPEDAIQLSSSVAQRRLAALMAPRGAQRPLKSSTPPPGPSGQTSGPPPLSRATTTVPILMHPYLPDPVPLQTPQTVRRNIISQELDEELRRNLLWERSQNQIQGRPPRAPGSILPGPWRRAGSPLRSEGNSTASATNASDTAPGKRSFATQRTKSWAGDYHASGW